MKSFFVGSMLCLPLLLAGCSSQDQPPQEQPAATSSPQAAAVMPPSHSSPARPAPREQEALDAAVKPVYTLKSSEDCTVDRDQPCRRINIVVPKGESKAQIASDLSHAAQEAQSSYGTVRGIVFADVVGAGTDSGYSAGRARWGTDEGTDHLYTAEVPVIDYEESYFKPEVPAATLVAGIKESERKRIFYETAVADNKATQEAEAAYPTASGENAEQQDQAERNYGPNMKMSQALTTKYEDEVQRRHHLSDDQYTAISVEGFDKHWPSPD